MIDFKETQIVNPAIIVYVSDDMEEWKAASLYSIDHRLPYPFFTHNDSYAYCKDLKEELVMHKDKFRTTVPDISHIVSNINDLMCCGNCVHSEIHEGDCIHKLSDEYCDNWKWDKMTQKERQK